SNAFFGPGPNGASRVAADSSSTLSTEIRVFRSETIFSSDCSAFLFHSMRHPPLVFILPFYTIRDKLKARGPLLQCCKEDVKNVRCIGIVKLLLYNDSEP